jgi:hypothetical protein
MKSKIKKAKKKKKMEGTYLQKRKKIKNGGNLPKEKKERKTYEKSYNKIKSQILYENKRVLFTLL